MSNTRKQFHKLISIKNQTLARQCWLCAQLKLLHPVRLTKCQTRSLKKKLFRIEKELKEKAVLYRPTYLWSVLVHISNECTMSNSRMQGRNSIIVSKIASNHDCLHVESRQKYGILKKNSDCLQNFMSLWILTAIKFLYSVYTKFNCNFV